MKKAVLISVALGVVGFLALTGFAAARQLRDPGRFITARVNKLLDDVQASNAQRQQILGIEEKLLSEGKALFQEHKSAHQELLAQWNSDRPDAAKVHALIDARIDALRTFAHQAADGALQVHGILTPQQRAQVAREIGEHHARMRGHHHPEAE